MFIIQWAPSNDGSQPHSQTQRDQAIPGHSAHVPGIWHWSVTAPEAGIPLVCTLQKEARVTRVSPISGIWRGALAPPWVAPPWVAPTPAPEQLTSLLAGVQ